MVKLPIVKEGWVVIGGFALVTALVALLFDPILSIIPGILTLFMCFFFRNPSRDVPSDDTIIVSPADGTVMDVVEVDDSFVEEPCNKVIIFLSVFDVHVNRAPIEGEIKYQHYICGQYKPAFQKSVGWVNERHSIGLDNGRVKILVTQIAGLLARRIVSWVTLGNMLEKGQTYGLIKFGSCTEIVMPKSSVTVNVKKGDRVKGGVTVIGRIEK